MKKIRKIAPFALLLPVLFLAFWVSCKNGTQQTNGADTTSHQALITPPDFNADSAYAWVKTQVDFSPRIPGTPAQQSCADFLEKTLKRFCKNVTVQKTDVTIYDNSKKPCINLIASFNPEQKKRILLFTHWDTRPWSDQDEKEKQKQFEGADDGGSGTAILLELAKVLSEKNCTVGVDLLLEDVEDYGPPYFEADKKWKEDDAYCLGTQYWCRHPHVPSYHAFYGILLDMVGSKDAKFYMDNQYAPEVSGKVWNAAQQAGYASYFINQAAPGGIIDDNKYVNEILHIPAIDIIALDLGSRTTFARHWHTQQDNMSIIDKNTLKAVGQTLLQVLYNEQGDAVN